MYKTIQGLFSLLLICLLSNNIQALDYSGSQENTATFETLEQARLSGPVAISQLDGNAGRTFVSHPVLDNYPTGTTWVYRSANLYGGRNARNYPCLCSIKVVSSGQPGAFI